MIKESQFKVGDVVKHTNGDSNPYRVIDVRYMCYPDKEEWEYTLQSFGGSIIKVLGSSLLVKFEQSQTRTKKRKGK